jgi:hypothetical protein
VAGAQGIAQGLAALGQGAAQGVQNYLKRKEEKQQEEATISTIGGILKRNPELASQLNLQPDATGNFEKGALKAFVNGAGGLPNALKLASTLEELGVARQARQQQADAARFAGMFDNQGQMLSPLRSDALAQFSPEASALGRQMVTQRAQAIANLGKTQADTTEALARAAEIRGGKPTPGYATPDEALKESKKLAAGQTGLSPSFTVVQGRYFPILRENPPSTFEPKDVQLAAESAQKRLDDFKSRFSTAIGAEQSAILVQEGIKKGVKTGAYTPITTYLKRAANDVGIKIEGLDEEVLAQKGIAGMQAGQIQLLARGLGSMSNADREFFVASVSGVTDPTKANQFFAELTIENAKLARQDQAYVRELERKGTSAAEINRLMDERIESRNVAKSVYDRVFTGKVNLSSNAAQFAN